jgi:hypothetical protein
MISKQPGYFEISIFPYNPVISKECGCIEIRDFFEIRVISKFGEFKKFVMSAGEPGISRDFKSHFTRKPWKSKAENFVSIKY